MSLLEVSRLKTYYYTDDGVVKAVNDVSFELKHGECLGIAGESGCGKSTLALSILRLIKPPGRIVEGEVLLDGVSILSLGVDDLRKVRWRKVSLIFQSAMNALNPVYTIGAQIVEALTTHLNYSKNESRTTAIALLESTGLPPSAFHMYPHELSGGMRQRALIAMALACNPKMLIADEPTTALDVVTQAQILALIKNLQKERNLSVIIISHDLSILAQVCDKLAIMYAGKIVEHADVEILFEKPAHPYTSALIRSFPSIKGCKRALKELPGQPPSLINPKENCLFSPRCPFAQPLCFQSQPEVRQISSGHFVGCHFAEDLREKLASVGWEEKWQ
ncbi:MAG: ABC transporter ATP-binding protein [Candidatus Bathyarchaeia archaeon]